MFFLSLPKETFFPSQAVSPFSLPDLFIRPGSLPLPVCSSCLCLHGLISPIRISFPLFPPGIILSTVNSLLLFPHVTFPAGNLESFLGSATIHSTSPHPALLTFAFICVFFSPDLCSTLGAVSHALPCPSVHQKITYICCLCLKFVLCHGGVGWGL